jgi:enoyl-CoA hydratase
VTNELRTGVDDGVGRITLDRPRAINALTEPMLAAIGEALDAWRHDDAVRVVLLDGAGERGFCAGADVRALRAEIVAGRRGAAREFFRTEYAVNAAIGEYPKPVVAFMDGVTMGGGLGLGAHAAVRVATERSRIAMPETRIGFTPDVGVSRLLALAPGRAGEHLALGAVTMDAADAIHAGLADHHVLSGRLGDLALALTEVAAVGPLTTEAVHAVVRRFATPAPRSGLSLNRAVIDEAYAAGTVAGIVDRLRAAARAGDHDAGEWADELDRLSPTALTVTLAAVRRARDLPDLRATLEQEYALACWFVDTQADFVEGVRAQVVDKDRSPAWRPAALTDVPDDVAASALGHTPAVPLW